MQHSCQAELALNSLAGLDRQRCGLALFAAQQPCPPAGCLASSPPPSPTRHELSWSSHLRCTAAAAVVMSAGCAGFIIARLFIGFSLAGIVCCQFWCTSMFNTKVVGTANAFAAGWGNMGGGVTHFLMPIIWQVRWVFGGRCGPTHACCDASEEAWVHQGCGQHAHACSRQRQPTAR